MSPKYNQLSDKELIAFLKERDRDAFAEMYQRYWSLVYMHALKMLKNEDDAGDIVQELFTTLWLKCGTIDSNVNLAPYLFVATKNKVLDLIAQKRVRVNYLESLASYMEAQSNQIVEKITERELMQALENEIRQLPPKMKQIFEMRVKQHLTYKEIAETLTISDKTVKKQISNAIKIITPKLRHLTCFSALLFFLDK